MPIAYGVKIYGLRWLAQNWVEPTEDNGVRPFKWTDDVCEAEKFDTYEDAEKFGYDVLGHANFIVRAMWFPEDGNTPDGGSSIAMRKVA